MRRLFSLCFPRGHFDLTARTASLTWLAALLTLALFAVAIAPLQKKVFLDNLRSKAYGVTVSLSEVTASAVVNEDYSSVVDHCMEMLRRDPAIAYIVITRNDGFSLIHTRESWDSRELPPVWHPARRLPVSGIATVPLFQRRVFAYSQPFDYSGIEWGWIHVGLTLDAYDHSLSQLYQRIAGIGALCLIFSLLVSFLHARHLVRPIRHLQDVVGRVTGGDLSARATIDRGDEIGALAHSVNRMAEALLVRDRILQEANETLEQRVLERTRELENQIAAREQAHRELADAQQRLMQLSREAGMAEVATGVLHNVGNVLNSINVSATLVAEQLGRSHLTDLRKASGLIREQGPRLPDYIRDDPRGRHLPDFVIEITEALSGDHARWRVELEGLARNISHIKEIVAMQQAYARVAGVIERLPPRELVDDAVRINEAAFTRHGITLTLEEEPVPLVSVDKNKVLQILINLLNNAKYAVQARPPGDRRVTVAISSPAPRLVHIVVRDNGIGIPAENLARIFNHGFTTRSRGHGFGLHTGALAAKSLGGALTVLSEGRDRGATFTLELPAGQ